ncbi:hypothetical protein [Faecalibacter macacae]|uniref:Peptidase M48 domain-containing protein n=1 Tax=Faecalibacter macacae TaxID=1859289 RepID=A0A3L9MA91_9FLAO|nr:hypothetical protein [Faecalibacter macacae]RLZ09908.1 hypothetical protein EAH69_07600 [Faecalibacter macacae]
MENKIDILNKNARKSLRKLQIGFLLIAIGSIVYFGILITFSAYIFNIYNWHYGVILPGFIFIIGLITSLMPLRYILILFQKIKTGENQINPKEEPELFKLLDEIKNEIGLKKTPKVFIENVAEVFTEYENQFNALFNPSKFNLVIGINHFQTLNRAELKALIFNELRKYIDRNEFSLIKFRNWEFSTGNMFYTSELTNETKISKFTILFSYIYIAEHILLKTHYKFSKNIKQFEKQLKELNKKENINTNEYKSANHKLLEYIIIKNEIEFYFIELLNNFYQVDNQFELYREVLKRDQLRKLILKNHQISLFNTTMNNTKIVDYYSDTNLILELSKTSNQTNYSIDNFQLNNQEKIEQNLSTFNNGLNKKQASELVNIFEEYYFNNTYLEFFETLQNFTEIDFKQIHYSAIDSSSPIKKEDLINQIMDLNNTNNTDSHTDSYFQSIDKLNNQLYIYLKSNHEHGSSKIIETILFYDSEINDSEILFYELDEIGSSIYTETRHKVLEELYKDFDHNISTVKTSLKEKLDDPELLNIIQQDVIDFIQNEINDNIVYYENRIYNKEAFDRITNLTFWNNNLNILLSVRYKKLYFDLNKQLITLN